MFDIKIYEEKKLPSGFPRIGLPKMEEMETIRDLTEIQKITIVAVLKRHGIRYLIKEVKK